MSITRTVHIARLYPSDIEDITKPFRNETSIHDPYRAINQGEYGRLIGELLSTIERTTTQKDPERTNAPYSGGVNLYVDAVNTTLSEQISDPAHQIPEGIHYLQLAHLQDPELDGTQFSYGLLTHYGQCGTPQKPNEFALLLPYERDTTTPALLLSNNNREGHLISLKLMLKAIQYVKGHVEK